MKELKEIKLFNRLEKLDKDFASQLKKTANKIKELINKKTTINFPNYTNHDINHSFKLMDTMYELIKDNKKDFNALEIALMIYSCLFHDIGMAMSDDEIEKIKNNTSKYLYSQDFKEVIKNNYDNEDLALQEIIRTSHGKIAYDLITSKYEEEFRLPEYENISFAQNLAEICLSHTVDRSYVEELETNTTKGKYEYNTQFLSILLRLSDILDIDSTRTPLALYEAIDLNDFSNGEWQKNFTIDNIKKIFKSNDLKEIKLEGSCKDIKIHRKLLSYIKWIENELRLAVDLTANMDKKYHILLNTEVKNKIKPIGYTIPDLKLNMDYHAVTNLLMGEAIYGSKDLGLRELLQNSIDAIMVKKDKLEMENHLSKDSYEPTINIDIDEKNNKVIISDNGMGMNEYIIKSYFLNVGKSYYKSKDFLNYKHNYNPIGNFGIGFLSCFMLSDEVQVITKHFNSNKKYTIDLEKNSEYIAFKEEEDNSNESGSKIILNLDTFCRSFKSSIKNIPKKIFDFIEKNILIVNFKLTINNTLIENLREKYRDKELELFNKEFTGVLTKNLKKSEIEDCFKTINLKNYFKDIEGVIKIEYTEYNSLKNITDNSKKVFFFNGKNLEEIDTIKELNLQNIVNNKNYLRYIKIPIIPKTLSETLTNYIEINNYNIEDSIQTLDDIHSYIDEIIIFVNKDVYIEESSFDDYRHIENSPIFIYKEIEYYIEDFINDLKLEKNENVEYFKSDKLYLIYNNNKNICFQNEKLTSLNLPTYIKYIKINNNFNYNYCLSNFYIKSALINIKSNEIQFDIKRENLIKDSNDILEYSIKKIIHEYIYDNIKLKPYQKILLKSLIDKFYSKNSILLK